MSDKKPGRLRLVPPLSQAEEDRLDVPAWIELQEARDANAAKAREDDDDSRGDPDSASKYDRGAFGDWQAVQRDHDKAREAHRAVCRAPFCNECERFACRVCARVAVKKQSEECWSCLFREHLPSINVPRRYAGSGFGRGALERLRSRLHNSGAVFAARPLIEGKRSSAVFLGVAGSGKSTMAAACIEARLVRILSGRPERVPSYLWVDALKLARARSMHRLGTGDEPELIEEALSAGILVIDDLGAESPRDLDVIAQVIHGRHDDDRVTWITTGLTPAEIDARYGSGIARRILEGALVIHCDAPEAT